MELEREQEGTREGEGVKGEGSEGEGERQGSMVERGERAPELVWLVSCHSYHQFHNFY